MDLKLIEPTMELENSYLDYIDEWRKSNERIIPTSSDCNNANFSEMFKKWEEEKTDKVVERRLVPANTYFLVDKNNRIYGSLNFRHYLNEHLMLVGGHIGYGIRPSERKKGYASKMLHLALHIIKSEYNIEKVLITCDKNNIGSSKTIISNGGILENEISNNQKVTQRYWIYLR